MAAVLRGDDPLSERESGVLARLRESLTLTEKDHERVVAELSGSRMA